MDDGYYYCSRRTYRCTYKIIVSLTFSTLRGVKPYPTAFALYSLLNFGNQIQNSP